MARVNLQRIHYGTPEGTKTLGNLRALLSSQGNVVSERGRALTRKVFGEELPPQQVVERVCADVRSRGREALFHYTQQFDNVCLSPETLRVTSSEMMLAHAGVETDFLDTIRRIRQQVFTFQSGLLHRDANMSVAGKYHLRMRYRPMRRVGIMVPGGVAAYPSTLLMTICPAQAAGVPELVVVMPPTPTGAYNHHQLAVCHELGVKEVYRVGGAQAVAALAYGVDGIPPVDMIVGPGNLFVALAIAGPSEVVVVADDSTPADYVAADLIAQAEHSPGSSILVTWYPPLLDAVEAALEQQLRLLDRGELARGCLEQFGALVLTRNAEEAIACVNELAPEHLHIASRDAEKLADRVDHAGAIFLGNYTPVALGDYAAGPSHVLPTGGTARFASGLSVNDFLHRSSVLSFTRDGLASMSHDVRLLAQHEGLTGHAASVTIRLTGAGSVSDGNRLTEPEALAKDTASP
jgi:histidinol dehydrogenase